MYVFFRRHATKAVPNFHAGFDLAAIASIFDMSFLISNILTGSSNALRPAFIRGKYDKSD